MKVWSFAPSITLPLFSGGNNLAQLRYAEAEKKGLIATYEKAIQSAFKDVADALARRNPERAARRPARIRRGGAKNAGCGNAQL
jgi:multidrug efflux system outer membrane protein